MHWRGSVALNKEGSNGGSQGRGETRPVAEVNEPDRPAAENPTGREDDPLHARELEAVGRLAAGVAHDCNNLLTVVAGHTQTVLEALPPGSGLREEMQQIQTEILRASRLTRQLLAVGRHAPSEVGVLDLVTVIEELRPVLRRLIPPRIEVDFDLGRKDIHVRADPSRIEQVVLNLAANAADAIANEGRITFALDEYEVPSEEAARTDWPMEAGRHARLTVEDTGHGMSREVAERIFDPFFSTKAKGKGSGLGLSTIFAIVQRNRGAVLVESAPQRGSRFQVLLPLVDRPAGQNGGGASPGQAPGPERAEGSGPAMILVADDTPAVLRVIRRTLEQAGYGVLSATDGREALDLIAGGQSIDLVVSDLVMPHVGGAALMDRLAEVRPDLPVVLTSGRSNEELATAVRSRAAGYLAKPFGPAELLQVVRETLRP